MNPLNGLVFYVGRTSTELKDRLYAHVKKSTRAPSGLRAILSELQAQGVTPVIEEIESVPQADRFVEEYWTQQFHSWGFPLVNTMYVKNKSFVGVRPSTIKLTDIEKRAFNILSRHGDMEQIAKLTGCPDHTARKFLYKKIVPEWFRDAMIKYYSQKAKEVVDWYNFLNATNTY